MGRVRRLSISCIPVATFPLGDPNNPTSYTVPDMATGLGGALTYNFDPHWGMESDFGYNWSSSDSVTTFSAWTAFHLAHRFDELLHSRLLSYNRMGVSGLNNGANGIGIIAGGGMDLPINKMFAWRAVPGGLRLVAPQLRRRMPLHSFRLCGVPMIEGVRLRTGIVYQLGWRGAPAPAAACSVQPTEVMVGEPITATVAPSNFNPKHTVTYAGAGTAAR